MVARLSSMSSMVYGLMLFLLHGDNPAIRLDKRSYIFYMMFICSDILCAMIMYIEEDVT